MVLSFTLVTVRSRKYIPSNSNLNYDWKARFTNKIMIRACKSRGAIMLFWSKTGFNLLFMCTVVLSKLKMLISKIIIFIKVLRERKTCYCYYLAFIWFVFQLFSLGMICCETCCSTSFELFVRLSPTFSYNIINYYTSIGSIIVGTFRDKPAINDVFVGETSEK